MAPSRLSYFPVPQHPPLRHYGDKWSGQVACSFISASTARDTDVDNMSQRVQTMLLWVSVLLMGWLDKEIIPLSIVPVEFQRAEWDTAPLKAAWLITECVGAHDFSVFTSLPRRYKDPFSFLSKDYLSLQVSLSSSIRNEGWGVNEKNIKETSRKMKWAHSGGFETLMNIEVNSLW